jgi:hypothetical protein
MFTTPAGSPASCITLQSIHAVTLVNSLGLQTAVHPNAIHGAIFQVNRYKGKFHGLISATTPTGVFVM